MMIEHNHDDDDHDNCHNHGDLHDNHHNHDDLAGRGQHRENPDD